MSEKYLKNYEILFLYTLLKYWYNWKIECDFDIFHPLVARGIPYILEFFISIWILKNVKVFVYWETNDSKEVLQITELLKWKSAHMEIFNKYSWCDPYDRIITFSFSALVNLEEIKKYYLEYLYDWENDNVSLEYVHYLKPSIQLEQFSKTINKEIEQRWKNFRYSVNNLEDLDEVTLIFYFYIKWYVNIKDDCVNMIDWSKNIWFNLIVDDSIYNFLNKYTEYKRVTAELYYNDFESILKYKWKMIYLDASKQTHVLTKVILRELSISCTN